MTQQQPASGGFNWARLSMGSKGLLVAGLLFVISCFLNWVDVAGEVEAITGFDVITFIVALQAVAWGAFLGLVLALALAYAAYIRFQESKVGTAPPPPVA